MSGDQRRSLVFETVKNRGEVSVQALVDTFGVSGMTIRRDLAMLEAQQLIRRAYGKAVWIARDYYRTASFAARCEAQRDAKRRIATLAAHEIGNAQSIFLDGSSTCGELAYCLPSNRRLTVYTNNLAAVQALREREQIRTFVMGGFVTDDGNSLDSDLTVNIAKSVNVDITFVSCSGFSARGLLNNGLPESRLKGVMMNQAERTCLLADHTKCNALAPFDISEWDSIDTFITDEALDPALSRILAAKRVVVRCCGETESENGVKA